MKAHELADIIEKKFGEVTFAAIDLDTDVNYPKGERWICTLHYCWPRLCMLPVICFLLLQVLEGSPLAQLTASWLQ